MNSKTKTELIIIMTWDTLTTPRPQDEPIPSIFCYNSRCFCCFLCDTVVILCTVYNDNNRFVRTVYFQKPSLRKIKYRFIQRLQNDQGQGVEGQEEWRVSLWN